MDFRGAFWRELEDRVELGDAVLDLLQAHRLAGTGSSSGAPGQAGVVLVFAAVASVAGEDQAGAAVAAEDRALEVVRMLAFLLSSQVVAGQHLLDAHRLMRKTTGDTVLYLPGQELHLTGSAVTPTRYYSSGTTTAMRVGGAGSGVLTWLAGDRQGSTQVAVNAATGAYTQQRYLPFGVQRGSQGPTNGSNRTFLGRDIDPSTGLLQDGARYYDPSLGRFLNPDPIATPTDPQNLNAYSYSDNNPITFSDPSGLHVDLPDDVGGGGYGGSWGGAPLVMAGGAVAIGGGGGWAGGLISGLIAASILQAGGAAQHLFDSPKGKGIPVGGGLYYYADDDTIRDGSGQIYQKNGQEVIPLSPLWTGGDRETIERSLGGNLAPRFEGIDEYYSATGLAVSIKSIDVRYDSYGFSSTYSKITSAGKRYVDDLVNFNRNGASGLDVRGNPISIAPNTSRLVLKLAYPAGLNIPQQVAFAKVVAYGKESGVFVQLIEIRQPQ